MGLLFHAYANVTCYLSSARLVAHKASTEFLHLFLSAAVTRASSHELLPTSLLSFSTVRLQVVFGMYGM